MQLCYRGNTYCRSSVPIDPIDSVRITKFMGNYYTVDYSEIDLTIKPALYQYRGIIYLKSITQLKEN